MTARLRLVTFNAVKLAGNAARRNIRFSSPSLDVSPFIGHVFLAHDLNDSVAIPLVNDSRTEMKGLCISENGVQRRLSVVKKPGEVR